MTRSRNRATTVALTDDRGWTIAHRIFCGLSAMMIAYFSFVATWVILHPVV